MPFIDTKIMCSICRGEGEYKPLAVFESVYRDNKKSLTRCCDNCRGIGYIPHRTFINAPKVDDKNLAAETPTSEPYTETKFSTEEANSVVEELKKGRSNTNKNYKFEK